MASHDNPFEIDDSWVRSEVAENHHTSHRILLALAGQVFETDEEYNKYFEDVIQRSIELRQKEEDAWEKLSAEDKIGPGSNLDVCSENLHGIPVVTVYPEDGFYAKHFRSSEELDQFIQQLKDARAECWGDA